MCETHVMQMEETPAHVKHTSLSCDSFLNELCKLLSGQHGDGNYYYPQILKSLFHVVFSHNHHPLTICHYYCRCNKCQLMRHKQ